MLSINSYTAYIQRSKQFAQLFERLVFVLVEEEVFLRRVIRPDVFNALVDISLVLYLLQVLKNFKRRPGTDCIVNLLVLRCRPWRIFEL